MKVKNLISIVITTRNRYKDLLLCLKSIKDSSEKYYEIIIIDDNSSDETKFLNSSLLVKKLRIKNPIKLIHNKKTEKMVKSRNIGVKIAKGKFIIFIDDDNIIDRNMIKKLVEFAEKNSDYGVIGPSMYYKDKTLYMNYQTINFFTGKTTGVIAKEKNEYYNSDGVPNVFLIKREVFKKAGYFDEDLIATYTEPDFSFHIKRFGYKTCILNDAKTFHNTVKKNNFNPRGLGGKFIQKSYCLMRNRTVIIARYGNILNKIIYTLFFSWFWPLLYSLIMIKYKKFDLIKNYWLGFYHGIIYMFTGKLMKTEFNEAGDIK